MTDIFFSIALMAVITALIRFLPFIIFQNDKTTPEIIKNLGKVLPYAIISMLVIFCLKSVDFKGPSHGLPELFSILVIVLIHFWKKNTILSILTGTICYVVIVNYIV